jgi:formylglycine-generating enzyme required for sulfatase activity
MGSSAKEVEYCVAEWQDHLLEVRYADVFRDWISKEMPEHVVHLDAFCAMRYLVTNGDYRTFLQATQLPPPESIAASLPDDHPVWGVSLHQAHAFAKWRHQLDGNPWRLPTEAEWEWMASGPDKLRYPYGNQFDPKCANSIESGYHQTTPVNAHPEGPSWCGAFDLAGNVEEWTASLYSPYPGGTFIQDDLTNALGSEYPILRGGSFALGGDLTRCARRHGPYPGKPFRVTGFRLVYNKV